MTWSIASVKAGSQASVTVITSAYFPTTKDPLRLEFLIPQSDDKGTSLAIMYAMKVIKKNRRKKKFWF